MKIPPSSCLCVALTATLSLMLPHGADAATIVKSDNANALNSGGSWVGAAVPGVNDVAQWESTVTSANAAALGGNLSWKGISVTSPGGAVTISAGDTLTLGTSGIDMSAATQNLTISSGLTLAAGNQVWNVASGRTLTLDTGTFNRVSGATLNVQGAGTVAAGMTGFANDSSGILGPWATVGTGSSTTFATLSAGNIVSYAGGTSGNANAFTNPGTGSLNYTITTASTTASYGAASRTMNTLRNTVGASTVTMGNSASQINLIINGILNAGTGTLTITSGGSNTSSGIMIGANNNRELVVNAANAAITLGRIINNTGGTSSVAILGPNTVTLNGANTYTGGTTISGGTVSISGTSPFGSGGTLFMGPGAIVSSTGSTVSVPVSGSGSYVSASGQAVIGGDWSGFVGTVSTSTNGDMSFLNNATAGVYNGTNANTAYVNNYAQNNTNGMIVSNTTGANLTVKMGSYSSVALSNLRSSGASANVVTFEIGNLNTDTTVAGGIGGIGTTASGGAQVALNKVGAGSMTLSGATGNGYVGGTTLTNGKLILTNTSGSATGSGAVAVSGGSTATLSGSGIATGAVTVTNGSRIAPGVNTSGTNSNFGVAGTLTAGSTGGLTLTDARLDFDLSNSAASGNDRIVTGGNLTLSANISFTFSLLNGTLDTSAPYTLISGATGTSGFDANALALNTTFVGLSENYLPTYSLTGNDLVVNFAAVPEPHEYAIGVVGLMVVAVLIRRRATRAVA